MLDSESHLAIYRSSLTGDRHRKFITVARAAILQDTIELLAGSAKRRSKHHFLFIGPRGIGKTHLLSLIEQEARTDKLLSKSYIVARFPEESNRVLSFADFLLGICEILKEVRPAEKMWQELYEQLHLEEDNAKIVDSIVPAIREDNRKRERTLIVMLENINEVFSRQIKNKDDIAAIRKFFMQENRCLLIATATMHFDGITDVSQPFYDFFDTQILEEFTEKQTIEFIRKNLEWDQRDDLLAGFDSIRQRILALYQMTGGNPRLLAILYELIANDAVANIHQNFEVLLDRITPFYQDRMNNLPPQERALLETMARMRDQDKTPSSIAEFMRISQPKVSSLLNRLSKSRYLKSIENPLDKRSRLYSIREGFFDIWLAMNLSRGARKRLPFLLDFFKVFYPSIEARERKRKELISLLGDVGDSDAETSADYLTEVGSLAEKAAAKLELAGVHAARGEPDKSNEYLIELDSSSLDSVGQWIVRYARQPSFEFRDKEDYLSELQEMIDCWNLRRSGNMEAFASKFVEMGGELSYDSVSEAKLDFLKDNIEHISDTDDRLRTRIRISNILLDLSRIEEAESQLRLAKNDAEQSSNPELKSTLGNNLAELYKTTGRYELAEPILREALQKDIEEFGKDDPRVATVMSNLAVLLQETNRLAEAEYLLRQAVEIDKEALGTDHQNYAIRLNNLAQLLQMTNRLAEAEPLMIDVLKLMEKNKGSNHPDVAIALNNIAILLQTTGRLDEAEPIFRRVLEINSDNFTGHHPVIARDLNNLAQLYQDKNEHEEATHLLERALEVTEKSLGMGHPNVSKVLNNLALNYLNANDLNKAEELLRRAIKIEEKAFGSTYTSVATTLSNLASVLRASGNIDEAESLIRRALEIDESSYGPNHPNIAVDLNNLASILFQADRLKEAKPLLKRAMEIYEKQSRSIGREHPNFQRAKRNLDTILKKLNYSHENALSEILQNSIEAKKDRVARSKDETTDQVKELLDEGRSRFIDNDILLNNIGTGTGLRANEIGAIEIGIIFDGDSQIDALPTESFLHRVFRNQPNHSGWPPWVYIYNRDTDFYPYVKDGAWEASIYSPMAGFPGHFDFWRIEPSGRLYTIRSLQDDMSQQTAGIEPKTVLDPVLLIYRIAETISVGLAFANSMEYELGATNVRFGFRISNLEGRSLVAWANPNRRLRSNPTCREQSFFDVVTVAGDTPRSEIWRSTKEICSKVLVLFEGYDRFSDEVFQNICAEALGVK